jgi:hypothetical protein
MVCQLELIMKIILFIDMKGNFPSGAWQKEQTSQVRNINATTPNGISYISHH